MFTRHKYCLNFADLVDTWKNLLAKSVAFPTAWKEASSIISFSKGITDEAPQYFKFLKIRRILKFFIYFFLYCPSLSIYLSFFTLELMCKDCNTGFKMLWCLSYMDIFFFKGIMQRKYLEWQWFCFCFFLSGYLDKN